MRSVLEVGDLKIGQSLAIVRFLSRKAGLQGKTEADFALSEMLIQEFEDVYMGLAKSNNSEDKPAAWTKFRDEALPKHFGNLENLLADGATLFSKDGLNTGDLAAFLEVNFGLDINADALTGFPKLAAFYEHVKALPAVQAYFAAHSTPIYFKVRAAVLIHGMVAF